MWSASLHFPILLILPECTDIPVSLGITVIEAPAAYWPSDRSCDLMVILMWWLGNLYPYKEK